MSNKTILDRIIIEINNCENTPSEKLKLAKIFLSSVEALDGVPYEKIKEADSFEYKITISGFYDEEGCEELKKFEEIKFDMINW